MTVMMKEERCASDVLLWEGKKKKPLNLLQRLGFDRSKEARAY
jgi:predicted CopG family antitoxin